MSIPGIKNNRSWRQLWHRPGDRRLVLVVLCVATGLLAGLASVLMHELAEQLHHFRQYCGESFPRYGKWLAPAFPAVGIAGCLLFAKLFFRRRGYDKGLGTAIRSARHSGSAIAAYHIFTHILTCGFAVGMGISAGMEAPSAITGAAIGDNLGRRLRLANDMKSMLLCAGAAAGIAAIFRAPLAGTLFACEVLLPGVSAVMLIPLLIAAAAGMIVSQLCGTESAFPVVAYQWSMNNIWCYAAVGMLSGICSWGIIRMNGFLGGFLRRFGGEYVRAFIGGAALYVSLLLLPALGGQGYNFIGDLLHNRPELLPTGIMANVSDGGVLRLLAMMVLLTLLKPIVSMLSLKAGGDGGMFGPSLTTGAFLGYAFHLLLDYFGLAGIPAINCVAAGMAGVLAGVMHAPLTGLFLIAELLGGYPLMVPLMVVVSLAACISKLLAKRNIYMSVLLPPTDQLHFHAVRPQNRRSGRKSNASATAADEAFTQPAAEPPSDQDIDTLEELEKIPVRDLADRSCFALSPDDSFHGLIRMLLQSRQSIFPVLDGRGRLVGLVDEGQIRPLLFEPGSHTSGTVASLMEKPLYAVPDTMTIGEASRLFESRSEEYLPVVQHNGHFVGMLSRSHILDNYRQYIYSRLWVESQ